MERADYDERDHGSNVVFDLDTYAELHLDDDEAWTGPTSDSAAIEVVPINSFTSTGRMTWQLAPRRTGVATVTARSESGAMFRLRVEVVDG